MISHQWINNRRLVALTVLFALLATAAFGEAMRVNVQRGVDPRASERASPSPLTAVLHTSEEAANLLSRAEEGAARQDWKLVSDALQRIIELPGEHVLTGDGQLYESARRYAQRRLAALPDEGLSVYRLMHDGEAAALLERASAAHDVSRLRSIVDKFLLTIAGERATLTLSAWLMEEGRFSEAASLLQWFKEVYPDPRLPAWVLPARLAFCLSRLGQTERAEHMVEAFAASQPAGRDGDPVAQKLGQVRAALARETIARDPGQSRGWPVAFGTLSRDGTMPSVVPSCPPELPWRMTLPVEWPRDGLEAVRAHAQREKLLPTPRMVTDGRVLLLKAGRRVLALDVDTFESVWEAEPFLSGFSFNVGRRQMIQPVIMVQQPANEQVARIDSDPTVLRMYRDHIGSDVTVGFGLALTIDWPNGPPPPLPFWGPDGQALLQGAFFMQTEPQTNTLLAYDLQSGKQRWTSETAGDNRELAGVQFMAAPIPFHQHLLAPCRVGDDLYAVLLDPATGRLVHHAYLCGLGGMPVDGLYSLAPCVADGIGYFPTGRGMLVALDLSDLTVRWASRYNGCTEKNSNDSWVPCPAVAVSDVVLLAPQDADALICFERATGRIRWICDRQAGRYVLGTDGRHVWIVGDSVTAVDVTTGRPSWAVPVGDPVGRGILSGDRLYVPTVAGLVALNPSTGERIHLDWTAEDRRLGNLLAFDGALLSASDVEAVRYPDLEQGYREALAEYQATPADGARALRLAWLEQLRDRPGEALSALSTVPETYEAEDPRRYAHLVHLRVRAILGRVAGGQLPVAEAVGLLEQARQTARRSDDAIASGLALGEFYHRHDRRLDATSQYLSLIFSDEGDVFVSDEGGLERRARLSTVQRLARLTAELTPGEAETFTGRLYTRLGEAVAGHDESFLLRLVEASEALPAFGDEAALTLAVWWMGEYRFEQAEMYLRRAIERTQSPRLRAEAIARLAGLYLQEGELHQPVSAGILLDRLSGELARQILPANVIAIDAAERGGEGLPAMLASAVAEQLRTRIDGETLATHLSALEPTVLGPPGLPETSARPGIRPLLAQADRVEPLADKRLLLLPGGERVEAHHLLEGRLLWPADLRMLGELSIETLQEQEFIAGRSAFMAAPREFLTAAAAVLDGQTLVLNGPKGLHALGVLTGRRLWSRPFQGPGNEGQDPSRSSAWFWAEGGFLATVDARGQLEASALDAADRVLWRRHDPARQWYWARIRGNFVMAMDAGLRQADIFGLADGQHVGSCRFQQPEDRVSIALYQDTICGPVLPDTVAARELATPGIERWRHTLSAPIGQIFKPSAELLALADRNGGLLVVDASTGKERVRTRVPVCEAGLTDGWLQDGILYVCGLQKRATGPSSGEQQRWAFAALRMSDGAVLWQRGEFGARTLCSADVLRTSSNVIPVATLVPTSSPPEPQQGMPAQPPGGPTVRPRGTRNSVEVVLLDKRTGQPLGSSATVPLGDDPTAGLILDLRARAGAVYLQVGSTWLRIPCPPVDPAVREQ